LSILFVIVIVVGFLRDLSLLSNNSFLGSFATAEFLKEPFIPVLNPNQNLEKIIRSLDFSRFLK